MIRLYLDENVPPLLAQQLRGRRFDVVSAHEVGMLGKSDKQHLEYASQTGRALLTFDTDFAPLAIRWLEEGRHHGGVVLSREFKMQQIGEFVSLCHTLLTQVQADEINDVVLSLQQFKPDN